MNLRVLLYFPLIVYALSYIYLALYHGEPFIFNVIVHESGTYTLLQTVFYASHFLGHIPMCTFLAFLFTGTYLCLTSPNDNSASKIDVQKLFVWIAFFLGLSLLMSLLIFGSNDTFEFMAQRKQSVEIYGQGGAWNLHLPSSMMLCLLIPIYIYIVKRVFEKSVNLNSRGFSYIGLGFLVFLAMTFLVNENMLDGLFRIWTDPRYLAHSVRELLTFPVTYFPIPLYFLMRRERGLNHFGEKNTSEKQSMNTQFYEKSFAAKQHCSCVSHSTGRHQYIHTNERPSKKLEFFILCLTILFLIGLGYQSYLALNVGIENLAQKPSFAEGGKLGVPYLLASHYFEHFLDTIFFGLLCLVLCGLARRKV